MNNVPGQVLGLLPIGAVFLLGMQLLGNGAVTIDANGWVLIIGAIFFGLAKLWAMWLDYQREKLKQAQLKEVAVQVAKNAAVHTDKLDKVVGLVEEVHKATNSLTDRLVETTAKEQFAAGVKQEQDKGKQDKTTKGF